MVIQLVKKSIVARPSFQYELVQVRRLEEATLIACLQQNSIRHLFLLHADHCAKACYTTGRAIISSFVAHRIITGLCSKKLRNRKPLLRGILRLFSTF